MIVKTRKNVPQDCEHSSKTALKFDNNGLQSLCNL